MVVGSAVSERYGVLGVHALFAQAENFVNLVGVPTFDRRGMNAESGCGVEQEALSNVGLLTGPTGDFAGIAIFADEEATTLTIVNLVGGIKRSESVTRLWLKSAMAGRSFSLASFVSAMKNSQG